MAKRSRTRRKDRRSVPKGRVYIQSTFNNTIVTITDLEGGVICWGSSGTVGYKGSRKSTAFAAQRAAEDATRKGKEQGLREVDVLVNGLTGQGEHSIVWDAADYSSGIYYVQIISQQYAETQKIMLIK